MTTPIKSKQTLIAHAYALAGSLGYTGESAYDFLHEMAGASSLLALDLTRLNTLCKILRSTVQSTDKPNLVSESQWRAVWALRRRLKCDEKQFAGIVKHCTGLDAYQFLDVASCRKLIAGMNKIADGLEAKKTKPRRAKA